MVGTITAAGKATIGLPQLGLSYPSVPVAPGASR